MIHTKVIIIIITLVCIIFLIISLFILNYADIIGRHYINMANPD